MKCSESLTKIAPALVAAQAAIESAHKTATNPRFDSSYAKLEDVIAAVKEPLNKNGIVFMQLVQYNEHGPYVETVLLHTSGEYITSNTPVLLKDANDPQKMGSGTTYAKKYALQAAIGLPTEDDDGNAAATPAKQPQTPPKPVKPLPPKTVDQMTNDACTDWIQRFDTADLAIAAVLNTNTLDAAAIAHIKSEHSKKAV